jgi:hypothetical protein
VALIQDLNIASIHCAVTIGNSLDYFAPSASGPRWSFTLPISLAQNPYRARRRVPLSTYFKKIRENSLTVARIMTCCFACGFDLRKDLPGSAQDQILPQAIDYQRQLLTAFFRLAREVY